MKRLHVAAAVIRNALGEILIAERPAKKHQGGLWEFPGGKVEGYETPTEALVRELQEEIGITATSFRPLIQIAHDYPDKHILLDVWEVDAFEGEAQGLEQQPVQWVLPHELDGFAFPEANWPIIRAAQLPARYLITPELESIAAVEAWLKPRLEDGIRLVQCRAKALAHADYLALAKRVHELCEPYGADVLINGGAELLEHLPALAGVHLPAQALMQYHERPIAKAHWLAASVHNEEELKQAHKIGVDFMVISPVKPTASHPEQAGLGWEAFAALTRKALVPVYALGGMSPSDLSEAWEHGAQGIAGISRL